MSKKISLGAAIAFMAIVAALTFTLTMVFSMNDFTSMMLNVRERESMYLKLSEISRTVREKYYYPVEEDKLMDNVSAGYLGGLGDKRSRYYSAEEYAAFVNQQDGEYVGIGLVPVMDPSGYIYVKDVYPDSPAQNSVQIGDMVVKVDTVDVTAENYEEMIAALRGQAGTKVSLTVRRGTEDLDMEFTRRQVTLPTVSYQKMENTGYLRIQSFTKATRDQFNKFYNKLISDGCTSMIIDLRDNEGGTLRSVSGILDILLPAGETVKAQYKDGVEEVLATSNADQAALPIVVLANNRTSNTAEVFIQALRDYNIAKIVGLKTAGDGSLQEMVKLSDGSAVNLTVALYKSPAGVVFDGEGIKPDYEVKLAQDAVVWDNLSQDTDPQLKKALELAMAVNKVEETTSGESSSAGDVSSSSEDESSSSDDESSSSDDESSSEDESSSSQDEESSSSTSESQE